MFESKQYEWKDIQLVLAGDEIAGVQEIKYTQKREKEFLYGRGSNPHSIQSGNVEVTGEIKVFQSELEKLILKSPGGDITRLGGLTMTVAYAPELGGRQTADVLLGVEFTEASKGMAQGDKAAEITLPFMALGVKHGV